MILKNVRYKGVEIEIVQCDITLEEVDAIVNAANSNLKHGGGVAGAIVRRGGYEIQRESDDIVRKNGSLRTGEAVVTTGGRLKARYVIHTVGPVWRGGNHKEDELLFKAVYNALKKAYELRVKSVSMPAISTGIYGFPKDRAVPIFAKAIKRFVDEHPDSTIRKIRICNIDPITVKIFGDKFDIGED